MRASPLPGAPRALDEARHYGKRPSILGDYADNVFSFSDETGDVYEVDLDEDDFRHFLKAATRSQG